MERSPIQHLWVPGQVPGLNELFAARIRHGHAIGEKGKRWNGYSDLKRMWEHRVVLLARAQQLWPMEQAYCTYLFLLPDRRHDPWNIIGGGVKLIEDGLQKAGILPNDGWKQILGYAQHWALDAQSPGTAVFLSKHNTLDRMTAIVSDQKARNLHGPTARARDDGALRKAACEAAKL